MFPTIVKMIAGMALLPFVLAAQVFEPVSPQLPDAQLGVPYSTYVLATIPDSTEVSGVDVAAMLIQEFPPLALFLTDIQGLNYPLDVSSVEFTVTGMPEGVDRTCTPSTCRFVSENVGSIVFHGTPVVQGTVTVNIASYTRGTLDISQLSANLANLGLPTSFELPSGLHTLYDQQYTLTVVGPNAVDEQEALGMRLVGQNEGTLTLRLSESSEGPIAFRIIDLSGRTVSISSVTASGPSTVEFDIHGLSSGMHLLIAEGAFGIHSMKFIR